jgi:hypothetical protein
MAELVEGAPLLREYGVNSSIEGSNPSLSAISLPQESAASLWRVICLSKPLSPFRFQMSGSQISDVERISAPRVIRGMIQQHLSDIGIVGRKSASGVIANLIPDTMSCKPTDVSHHLPIAVVYPAR